MFTSLPTPPMTDRSKNETTTTLEPRKTLLAGQKTSRSRARRYAPCCTVATMRSRRTPFRASPGQGERRDRASRRPPDVTERSPFASFGTNAARDAPTRTARPFRVAAAFPEGPRRLANHARHRTLVALGRRRGRGVSDSATPKRERTVRRLVSRRRRASRTHHRDHRQRLGQRYVPKRSTARNSSPYVPNYYCARKCFLRSHVCVIDRVY